MTDTIEKLLSFELSKLFIVIGIVLIILSILKKIGRIIVLDAKSVQKAYLSGFVFVGVGVLMYVLGIK